MTEAEWGPWIEHDGETPPKQGTAVQVKSANGRCEMGIIGFELPSPVGMYNYWVWKSIPPGEWGHRVILYRIRKPKGMEVLETILSEVTETEREDELA